jgi:hypothetical protein
MLQAHSPLWHYLWVAPNVCSLVLAALLWRRKLHKQFPVFFVFAVLGPIEHLSLYAADVLPSVSGETFWRAFWVGQLLEAVLKFALVGEIFAHVFDAYPAVARLGKFAMRGVGVTLVFAATIAAAFAPIDNPNYTIISRAHILEQTIYIIECGLLLFIFLFAGYFRLAWSNWDFGIALGLSISACVHLATWAVMANGGLPEKRYLLDFLNLATYHACVLIWFYYLLIQQKIATKPAINLPENNLELWNRELERLLQQ